MVSGCYSLGMPRKKPTQGCKYPSCSTFETVARGLCGKHYRWDLNGIPANPRRRSGIEVEWLQGLLVQVPDGLCRDWPFSIQSRDGRPVPIRWKLGQMLPTTAMMYMISDRPSPKHGALHSCDRPVCCAPWHLRWGTAAENMADMKERKRHLAHRYWALRDAILAEPGRYPELEPLVTEIPNSRSRYDRNRREDHLLSQG